MTDCAAETGIPGFVSNLSDGSVLIVAEEEDDPIEPVVNLIRADGDPAIRVATLDITKSLSTGKFRGFGIR